MSSGYDPIEVISPPYIDVTCQGTGICRVLGTKSQAQDGLDFSCLSKHSFLGGESISTERPEFNVFHTTADQTILCIWVKLDIKHLNTKKYP